MLSSLFTLTSVVAALTGHTDTKASTAQRVISVPPSCATAAQPATLFAMSADAVVPRHAASPGELEAVRGQYTLADGRVLSVAPRARSLMADIGDGPAQSLHPVAYQVYRTSDGTLELAFTMDDHGQVLSVRVAQRVAR